MAVVKQMHLEEIVLRQGLFEALLEADLWAHELVNADNSSDAWHAYVCLLARNEQMKLIAKGLAELISARPSIVDLD